MIKGIRLGSGLISVVAAATTTRLFTLGTVSTKKAIIRKIFWHNRTGGNGTLSIGYLTLGAVFTPVLPLILMLNGIDGQLEEVDIPITGNTVEGFCAERTLVTGSLGNIDCQTSVGGAAPADVLVSIEVEVF